MKIIAFANQKGGVAKTNSVYNVGCVLAQQGKSVLLCDLDPQASLTILAGMMPGKQEKSVCDLFNLKEDPFDCGYVVEATGMDNLYIIPSDIELAEVEQNLTGKTAREKILKKQLDKFDGSFDYILCDCPPQLGILTTNALVAADICVVPTKSEYLSYRGVRALKRTIQTVREEFNPKLELMGFIITMYEKVINDQRDMLELFEKEAPIIGTVKKSADVYRSVLEGIPVVLSNKNSDVAKSYVEIGKTFL